MPRMPQRLMRVERVKVSQRYAAYFGPGYYAANVADFDGNHLEVVHKSFNPPSRRLPAWMAAGMALVCPSTLPPGQRGSSAPSGRPLGMASLSLGIGFRREH